MSSLDAYKKAVIDYYHYVNQPRSASELIAATKKFVADNSKHVIIKPFADNPGNKGTIASTSSSGNALGEIFSNTFDGITVKRYTDNPDWVQALSPEDFRLNYEKKNILRMTDPERKVEAISTGIIQRYVLFGNKIGIFNFDDASNSISDDRIKRTKHYLKTRDCITHKELSKLSKAEKAVLSKEQWLSITDTGIGMTGEEMVTGGTMSLNKGNKAGNLCLAGAYGQGGTTALRHAGASVLISRKQETDDVNFSMVWKVPPQTKLNDMDYNASMWVAVYDKKTGHPLTVPVSDLQDPIECGTKTILCDYERSEVAGVNSSEGALFHTFRDNFHSSEYTMLLDDCDPTQSKGSEVVLMGAGKNLESKVVFDVNGNFVNDPSDRVRFMSPRYKANIQLKDEEPGEIEVQVIVLKKKSVKDAKKSNLAVDQAILVKAKQLGKSVDDIIPLIRPISKTGTETAKIAYNKAKTKAEKESLLTKKPIIEVDDITIKKLVSRTNDFAKKTGKLFCTVNGRKHHTFDFRNNMVSKFPSLHKDMLVEIRLEGLSPIQYEMIETTDRQSFVDNDILKLIESTVRKTISDIPELQKLEAEYRNNATLGAIDNLDAIELITSMGFMDAIGSDIDGDYDTGKKGAKGENSPVVTGVYDPNGVNDYERVRPTNEDTPPPKPKKVLEVNTDPKMVRFKNDKVIQLCQDDEQQFVHIETDAADIFNDCFTLTVIHDVDAAENNVTVMKNNDLESGRFMIALNSIDGVNGTTGQVKIELRNPVKDNKVVATAINTFEIVPQKVHKQRNKRKISTDSGDMKVQMFGGLTDIPTPQLIPVSHESSADKRAKFTRDLEVSSAVATYDPSVNKLTVWYSVEFTRYQQGKKGFNAAKEAEFKKLYENHLSTVALLGLSDKLKQGNKTEDVDIYEDWDGICSLSGILAKSSIKK